MRRAHVLVLTLVLAMAIPAGTASTTHAAAPGFEAALRSALTAPGIGPRSTAALAVDVASGDVVFRMNAGRSLLPASAEKLAVSFAALRVLGPDFRFHTELVGTGTRVGRTWRGNLVLVGHGDPTLAVADLDRL
ncbi:MAG TPA: D-alanyl-D-alanine carboxypeptidase, partial [Jiangellaceae bacterium]